jgi:hypothetical protein
MSSKLKRSLKDNDIIEWLDFTSPINFTRVYGDGLCSRQDIPIMFVAFIMRNYEKKCSKSKHYKAIARTRYREHLGQGCFKVGHHDKVQVALFWDSARPITSTKQMFLDERIDVVCTNLKYFTEVVIHSGEFDFMYDKEANECYYTLEDYRDKEPAVIVYFKDAIDRLSKILMVKKRYSFPKYYITPVQT